MKKLTFLMCLMFLAFGTTNVWAETETVTFTNKDWSPWTKVTSGSSFESSNSARGVANNGVNGSCTSTESYTNVTKVSYVASSNTTGGKVTIKVGNTVVGESSITKSDNTTYEYDVDNLSGNITLSVTKPSSKTVWVKSITIVTTSSEPGSTKPALSSIVISGDMTNKNYEEGEKLDFSGLTVQANYENGDPKDVTNEVEWSYTPNPLTKGTTSVEVTATYEDKTATQTINGLTVTEHVVTPGEYDITLNNVFFGTTENDNITGSVTGKQNDITITINGTGSTKPRTDATYTRFYANSTMAISVPSGYVIKSIAITKNESDYANPSVTIGAFDNSTKTWTGTANSVTMSFSNKSFINSIKVIYAVDVKHTLNITTPSNGTLVVKDGSAVLADGAQVYEGTKLVVTPTPKSGYLFESLTVDGTPVDLTEGSYNLTMPAANVTIAATFKANEKPDATLTLSKNGVTETFPGLWKQDDVVILPSITSDCVKAFVGWSANANCTTEPEYKAGDEYTLASETQTLYAVYADEKESTITEEYTFQSFNSAQDVTLNSTSFTVKLQKGNGSTYPKWDSGSAEARIYAKGLLTIEALKPIVKVVYTYTINQNSSGKQPTIDGVAGKKNAGTWDADAKTWTGSASEVTLSTSGTAGNIGFTKVAVTLVTIGFENYSTTCAAALKKPIFSVTAGTYTEAKSIELSATDGYIYYTLDGTEPTKSSTQYTAAIDLDECGTTTIKAIAISTESQSPVASATYTINLPITNTAATAYTPAEAIAIIDGACDKSEEVYVKGVVVATSEFNATYGNYDVIVKAVDDKSATPTTFTFYRMYKAASNTKFTESDEVIGVDDIITAKGKLTTYNYTYELAAGCYLVEHTPSVKADAELAWNPVTVSLTVGDAFTAPTFSNPNRLAVSFESSNTELATVNNAGVISLVSGKTGTATITATYAGDETYKPAEVTCVIKVNPVTDEVVILAQHAGNWYAMMAQCPTGETNRLAALHVDYFNGTLYNVTEENKALITWARAVVGDKVTFQHNGKYLKGKSSTDLILEEGETGLYLWDKDTYTMTIGQTIRTFLYNGEAFRNFAAKQASNGIAEDKEYSSLPVVATPVYSAEEFVSVYTRSELPVGSYGTICLPYAVNNYTGATFYEVAGKEGNKIVFDEVTELEAGKPYIFMAEAAEIKLAQVGEAAIEAGNHNSLQGTFTQIDPAEDNILVDNYMVVNNVIKKCGINCGLQANRAYFIATALESLGAASQPMSGRRRVTMGVTGENEATGVDNITENGVIAPKKLIENGQLIIIRNGVKFNAQGVRL